MMSSWIGVEDWALPCSWLPAGDQWQYSVDQFFEPVELLGNKSDDAERQLFEDDITVQQQSFNTAWSNCSSSLEDTVEKKSALATSYLMSPTEHIIDMFDRRSSPWEELPSSPETFRLINNYELPVCVEMNNDSMPWQQELYFHDTASSQSAVASSWSAITGVEPSDVATVPECELSTEDMLLDLDEAISDVIMNPLKLADIGLYLPPVSADDVDSLLSSHSTVAISPPAADPVSLDVAPFSSVPFAVYHDLSRAASPLTSGEETSDVASNFQACQQHAQAASPLTSETKPSVSATCLLVDEEQVQVPSPASSQSSTLTLSSGRKQRKKEQNKNAAQKYRQKKRGEQGLVMTEYEQLERKNIELRTRVEEMTREVDYLKGLIEEICA